MADIVTPGVIEYYAEIPYLQNVDTFFSKSDIMSVETTNIMTMWKLVAL